MYASSLCTLQLPLRLALVHSGRCKRSRARVGSLCPAAAQHTTTATSVVGSVKLGEDSRHLEQLVLEGARVTHLAHCIWQRVLRPGDMVIDATAGNGHDTLKLARTVLHSSLDGSEELCGMVHALDIQEDAISTTKWRLQENLTSAQMERVHFTRCCHSQLDNMFQANTARLVCFNLGYLPGLPNQREVRTSADTTAQAVQGACRVLAPGGLLSVIAYIGHPGGREEYEQVCETLAALPMNEWVTSHHCYLNKALSPRLLLAQKKADSGGAIAEVTADVSAEWLLKH
eukprot:jgi/Chlat1/2200/Chrsp17S08748